MVDTVQGTLQLPMWPSEASVQWRHPILSLIHTVDRRNRIRRHTYAHYIPIVQLLPILAIERNPGGRTCTRRDLKLKISIIGKHNGPEIERVGTHRCEENGWYIGMDHWSSCGCTVRCATGWSGDHHAVSLDGSQEVATLKHIYVGEKWRSPPI